jgi:methyl-accepting chemotaxis protein
MARSISTNLTFPGAFFLTLILSIGIATVVVLQRQLDDGVIVNLSGRERMLTQRLAHQLLGYSTLRDQGKTTAELRNATLATMQVFERTLDALERGGPAPLDMQSVTSRVLPEASPAVADQLQRVRRAYENYRGQARNILDGPAEARQLGVNYVIENNTELLSEMNTAVFLFQDEAERRVKRLYYIQGGALALGLLAFLVLSAHVRRSVLEPLRYLSKTSDSISRGNVVQPVEVGGARELMTLGSAIERLRLAMKNMLPDAGGF